MVDMTSSPAHVVRFGVFALDLRSGELRKGSRRGHLPDQPMQVLALLLEHPGELVTREELRQRLWPADTYVDFERGLNAAVKRLRDALGDSADAPQFIETLHRRGYRFIAPVEPAAESPHTDPIELSPINRAVTPIRRALAITVAAAALIVLATGAYVVYRSARSRLVVSPRPLSRLTFDPGLQTQPTWSPDGRFIAYSSDRSGNFDIWVQPVAGGDAVQVTRHPAHDSQPDWSPDGSQIVFRSERDGGGLYLVPPLGGHERRLTNFGYTPRWSPDGTRILFAAAAFRWAESLSLYLVRLDGGPPRQILKEFLERFLYQVSFAWHPDGERLSVWGWRSPMWTVPVEGGVAVRSEWAPEVKRTILETALGIHPSPQFAWAPSGRAVFFRGLTHGVRNIWKVDVDRETMRWVGGLERLTTGPGEDTDLALSRDGRSVAFVTSPGNPQIWVFPFNASAGRIEGDGQPVTPEEWNSWAPDVTDDGRKVVFLTEQPGRDRYYVTQKSLSDGSERRLALDEPDQGEGRGLPLLWSPDGARLAYKYLQRRDGVSSTWLRTMDAATGQEQQVTSPYQLTERWGVEGRYENASDWSGDGKWILATGARYAGGRGSVVLLSLSAAPQAEKQPRVITSDACHALYQAKISADDRWIVFQALSPGDEPVSTLYVVARSGGPWMQITDGSEWDSDPRWSPDGKVIYYMSSRGGDSNLWAIRFDPAQGRPLGEAFRVTSFQGPRQMIVGHSIRDLEWGMTRNRLVLVMRHVTGGIWVLGNVDH